MFHALTGCDTVSFFHSKGKKTTMAAWNMVNDVNGPFLRIMQQPDYIREEDMNTIEQFVVVMYDKSSQSSNVNEARLQLFAKKSRSLENIPPTKAALEQHVRRAALQANCWEQMFEPSPTLPQPDKCGWISVDGTWQPKWSDLPEVVETLRILVKCGCKKGCKKACKCSRSQMKCTALCYCGGECSE